jgi:hypothetical protein
MIFPSSSKLERFYDFFGTHGTERLNGLDESYFSGLDADEKEEVWNFLKNNFSRSAERINGLYILDKFRAIVLFKQALEQPIEKSAFSAERQELESARLLMLRYVNSVEPDEKYVAAMSEFACSEFKSVRAEFAQSLPVHQITPGAVEALKQMIFTETEALPLTSAITKLMVIHGLDFNWRDPLRRAIYSSLASDSTKEKLLAMRRLEKIQQPDFL